METIEIIDEPQNNVASVVAFNYHGKPIDFFKIFIVNLFLLIITLGFYYPWAKAKILHFNYGETEMKGSRFTFHGTGKEMFSGLIKAIILFGTWYGLFQLSTHYLVAYAEQTGILWPMIAATLVFYMLLGVLIPLAIVGSVKYRASRSSWRGIHFQYTGTLKSMYDIFFKGMVLSIITSGIYFPWMLANIYKEIASNLKWGNIRFDFTGEGGKIFVINFVGLLLSYITLGIFYFKFKSNYRNYIFNNISLSMNENRSTFKAETTGTGYFKLFMGNAFIMIFTLGLGAPYVMVRVLMYHASTTTVVGNVDFDEIEQGEIESTDAFGEGLMDTLELDLI